MANVRLLEKRPCARYQSAAPVLSWMRHTLPDLSRPTSAVWESRAASPAELPVPASPPSRCARCSTRGRIARASPAAPYSHPNFPPESYFDLHKGARVLEEEQKAFAPPPTETP